MIDPRVNHLRDNAMKPERLLWRQLRNKRVAGLRFRRQFPNEGVVRTITPTIAGRARSSPNPPPASGGRTHDARQADALSHGIGEAPSEKHQ